MRKTLCVAFLLLLATATQAQYAETFSTPDKGYLLNQVNDFTGVDWTLSPWANQPPVANGRDSSDYFQTTVAGVLEAIDLDQEVCWESPLLNTTAVGTVSFSVNLTWAGFDTDQAGDPCTEASLDYIKVQYSVNGGPYTTVPNVAGGSACATVGYVSGTPGNPFSGMTTVQVNSIPGGSTLQIRVCVNTNANAEVVTIDKVSVPDPGVTVGCSAPELSTFVIPVGCLGPNSGGVNLTVFGGTPGFSFSWSNGVITEDIVGVAVGIYTVTVTDAANCTASTSAMVGMSPAILLSLDIGPVTCAAASDGEIDLIISGGTPGGGNTPLLINWGDLPGVNDPEDRSGLAPGTYTVTVTDGVGCTATASATIGLAAAGAYLETFSASGKGLLPGSTCSGINATSCTKHNFIGVNWSIYGLDTLSGIEADDYFYTFDGRLQGIDPDQELCWESPLIEIAPPGTGLMFSLDLAWEGFDSEPAGPNPQDLVADHIDVEYSLDGGPWQRVANQAGSGITGHTIVYSNGSGSGLNGSHTVTVSGLTANSLRIRVCGYLNANVEKFSIDNVSVPNAAGLYCTAPEIDFAVIDVNCFGGSDGAINLVLSGGIGPFTYLWSNGMATEDISDVPAGIYTVQLTNGLGQTVQASVQVDEALEILVAQSASLSKPVSCFGGANGALGVQLTNGQPPFNYLWSNGSTTNPNANLSSGAYSVTATDSKGCTGVLNNMLLVDPLQLQGSLKPYDNSLCPGTTTTLAVDVVVGGTPPYFVLINGGGVPVEAGPGQYIVEFIDGAGCMISKTIVITGFPPSNAAIAGMDSACVAAAALYNLPGSFSNYSWTVSGNGMITAGQGSAQIDVLWNAAGAGLVSANFTNADGCPEAADFGVAVDICVGVHELELPGVQVAPNPFGDQLSVRFDRPVEPGTRLQLRDVQGRLLLEQNEMSGNSRFETAQLVPGVYLLFIQEGERYGVWKLVKT